MLRCSSPPILNGILFFLIFTTLPQLRSVALVLYGHSLGIASGRVAPFSRE